MQGEAAPPRPRHTPCVAGHRVRPLPSPFPLLLLAGPPRRRARCQGGVSWGVPQAAVHARPPRPAPPTCMHVSHGVGVVRELLVLRPRGGAGGPLGDVVGQSWAA